MARKILQNILKILLCLAIALALMSAFGQKPQYRTFADHPGFREYYSGKCREGYEPPVKLADKKMLERFRPRIIIPPAGRYPVDFYEDYLPFTVLRKYPEGKTVAEKVTPELLRRFHKSREHYLDFQPGRFERDRRQAEPALYGRVYRERVGFPCEGEGTCYLGLTFLKYNLVFTVSGLPKSLPLGARIVLKLGLLDPDDWHELDNFVAVHVVLDDSENPIAVLLAQHNHHRTYMVGSDIALPPDGRLPFDVAVRSNEVYLASGSTGPVEHRAVRRGIYMGYLLSGEDPPLYHGHDITYGVKAGGKELHYDILMLSSCDPFYTAEMMLGEPRALFGHDIGRDGPPGADYYNIPALLDLGDLLKASYLRDGDPDDIRLASEAMDVENMTMDVERLVEYGGAKFYRDIREKIGR